MMILAFLKGNPRPAFDIAQEIKRLSNGKLELQRSTLYPLLNKLQKEGLITASWLLPTDDIARRTYTLTSKGEAEADSQVEAWKEYALTVGQVLRGIGQ